jgi:DNA-binding Lrp family transcriptional regulator
MVGGAKASVDELDFKILKELFAGDTDSFRSDRASVDEIARRLGTHRNTVSARIKKLTQRQIFLPMTVEIDPGRLGMVGARVFMEVPPQRRTAETRDDVFHLEGVFGVLAYHDGWDIVLYGEDEASLASKVEVARALTGARRVSWELHTSRDYPQEQQVRITPLDARLIAALLRDARSSFGALAKEVGVTARTLERRYRRLKQEEVISMLPTGTAAVKGMIMGYVTAQVPEEPGARIHTVRRMMELLPNHFVRNVATRGRIHLFLYGSSLADLEEQVSQARKIPGMDSLTFRIFVRPYPNPRYRDWLARVLERRAVR